MHIGAYVPVMVYSCTIRQSRAHRYFGSNPQALLLYYTGAYVPAISRYIVAQKTIQNTSLYRFKPTGIIRNMFIIIQYYATIRTEKEYMCL